MQTELLKNIQYDEIKVSLRQRIVNFLFGKGFIKSKRYIFGG